MLAALGCLCENSQLMLLAVRAAVNLMTGPWQVGKSA